MRWLLVFTSLARLLYHTSRPMSIGFCVSSGYFFQPCAPRTGAGGARRLVWFRRLPPFGSRPSRPRTSSRLRAAGARFAGAISRPVGARVGTRLRRLRAPTTGLQNGRFVPPVSGAWYCAQPVRGRGCLGSLASFSACAPPCFARGAVLALRKSSLGRFVLRPGRAPPPRAEQNGHFV